MPMGSICGLRSRRLFGPTGTGHCSRAGMHGALRAAPINRRRAACGSRYGCVLGCSPWSVKAKGNPPGPGNTLREQGARVCIMRIKLADVGPLRMHHSVARGIAECSQPRAAPRRQIDVALQLNLNSVVGITRRRGLHSSPVGKTRTAGQARSKAGRGNLRPPHRCDQGFGNGI